MDSPQITNVCLSICCDDNPRVDPHHDRPLLAILAVCFRSKQTSLTNTFSAKLRNSQSIRRAFAPILAVGADLSILPARYDRTAWIQYGYLPISKHCINGRRA